MLRNLLNNYLLKQKIIEILLSLIEYYYKNLYHLLNKIFKLKIIFY